MLFLLAFFLVLFSSATLVGGTEYTSQVFKDPTSGAYITISPASTDSFSLKNESGTNLFNIVTSSGDTTVSGVLDVTSTASFHQTLTIEKEAFFSRPINANVTGNVTGNLTGNVTGNVTGTATNADTSATTTWANYASTAGRATIATNADTSATTTWANYASTSGRATIATNADTSATTTWANYASTSGRATIATNADTAATTTWANYASTAGTATYASTSATTTWANYASTAGRATTATTATTAAGLTGSPSITVTDIDAGGVLDVTGSTSLDGIVVLQDDVMFGTRSISGTGQDQTKDLLEISLPTGINSYIGTVDVIYIGNIVNAGEVLQDVEIFKTRYLISRMSFTNTATIKRLSDEYMNNGGGIATPSNNAVYATSLDCETGSTWTPDANTIRLRYRTPSSDPSGFKDKNVTILYEIRSGGVGNYPVNLQGLWAR